MNTHTLFFPFVGSATVELHKKPAKLMRPHVEIYMGEVVVDCGRVKLYLTPLSTIKGTHNEHQDIDSNSTHTIPPDNIPDAG